MSAPVDVLAVMDLSFRDARDWRGREGWAADDMAREDAAEAEARAAVAELVDAAEKALPRKLHNDTPETERLRAAVARVGGAK